MGNLLSYGVSHQIQHPDFVMHSDNDRTNAKTPLLGDGIAVVPEQGDEKLSSGKMLQPCRSENGLAAKTNEEFSTKLAADNAALCARDMDISIQGIALTINRLNEIAFNHALASENQNAAVVAEVRRSIQKAARGIQIVSQTLGKLKAQMLETGVRHEAIMGAALALDTQSAALQGAVSALTGKIEHL